MRLQAAAGAPVLRLLEGRYGIARREWGLLALLHDGGPQSPSALAAQTQRDRPRTSRALAALVAKGLVAREPLPGDARRVRCALTEAGRALYAQAFPQVAALNAELAAALDDATLDALERALQLLTERAQQLNARRHQDLRADRRAGGTRRARLPPR